MEEKIVLMVKLMSGEEVLTNVIYRDNNFVTLSQPRVLMMREDGLSMMPWLMLAEKEEVTIHQDKILMTYPPKTGLANAYKQNTGGIVTAPATALNNLRG